MTTMIKQWKELSSAVQTLYAGGAIIVGIIITVVTSITVLHTDVEAGVAKVVQDLEHDTIRLIISVNQQQNLDWQRRQFEQDQSVLIQRAKERIDNIDRAALDPNLSTQERALFKQQRADLTTYIACIRAGKKVC